MGETGNVDHRSRDYQCNFRGDPENGSGACPCLRHSRPKPELHFPDHPPEESSISTNILCTHQTNSFCRTATFLMGLLHQQTHGVCKTGCRTFAHYAALESQSVCLAAESVRTVTISAGDNMKFDTTAITAKPGEGVEGRPNQQRHAAVDAMGAQLGPP